MDKQFTAVNRNQVLKDNMENYTKVFYPSVYETMDLQYAQTFYYPMYTVMQYRQEKPQFTCTSIIEHDGTTKVWSFNGEECNEKFFYKGPSQLAIEAETDRIMVKLGF